jgi:hypothetical protein
VVLAVEIENGGLRVELFRLLNDERREDSFSWCKKPSLAVRSHHALTTRLDVNGRKPWAFVTTVSSCRKILVGD